MMQRRVRLHVPTNEKMDIEFENLSFTVSQGRKGKKRILHEIDGSFKSGELTGIMGPSGAGKSTLLNILSGFQKSGTSGTVRCTAQKEKCDSKVKYRKDSCYILQDDRLCPLFTVLETMNMAAKLKLGTSISEKAQDMLIADILDTIGLAGTVDTRCGQLSGGQRKRLSVALELIDNPPIMFLDEPTTGLDSSSTMQCVKIMKNLAKDGRTIVCTIHQPSASIFEMFDHIYVLADGHCIYQGSPVNTVEYLAAGNLQCPQYHNPADFLIEVASGEYGNFVEPLSKAAKDTTWRLNKTTESWLSTVDEVKDPDDLNEKTMVLIRSPSEFYRFKVLLRRSVLQLYRDWTTTHLKVVLHVLVGIFVGLLYKDFGNDGSKTLKNTGYFVVSIVYLVYTAMMPAVLKFPSELPVLKKENFNNWYKLPTYYIASVLVQVPTQVMFTLIYSTISYVISGQPMEPKRLIMYTAIIICSTLTGEAMGAMIGTFMNPVNGTFLGCILTALFLVFAGFVMLYSHMTPFMLALSYISYLGYAVAGAAQAIYGYGREQLPCPYSDDVEYCHYKDPRILLEEYGLDTCNYFADLTVLFFKFVVLRTCAYFTLRKKLFSTQFRMIVHVILGMVVGLLFQNSGNSGSATLSNAGLLLVITAYQSYTSMMPAAVTFPAQIPIIKKECYNNWYRLRTLYFAVLSSSLPLQVIFSVCFSLTLYLMTEQPLDVNRYCMFQLISVLTNVSSESFGILVGTLTNPVNATFIAAVSFAYFLLLAGYLIFFSDMSVFFYGLSFSSYLSYSFDGLVQSIYGFNRQRLPCPDDEFCYFNSPRHFLKEIGSQKFRYHNDVLLMVLQIFLLKFVAFHMLKRSTRQY